MATKTFEELKQLAIQIRDEKTNKQNTATRVGTAMLEHINKLEQDYYDKNQTDEELKERDDKLTELESIIEVGKYCINIGYIYTNGVLTSNSNFSASNFIAIKGLSKITFWAEEEQKNLYLAVYDKDKKFVRQFSNSRNQQTIDIQNNECYIRYSVENGKKFYIIPFGGNLILDESNINITDYKLDNSVFSIDNKYISNINGEETKNVDFKCTPFLEALSKSFVFYNEDNSVGIALYDNEKKFTRMVLPNNIGNPWTKTACNLAKNERYIRLSLYKKSPTDYYLNGVFRESNSCKDIPNCDDSFEIYNNTCSFIEGGYLQSDIKKGDKYSTPLFADVNLYRLSDKVEVAEEETYQVFGTSRNDYEKIIFLDEKDVVLDVMRKGSITDMFLCWDISKPFRTPLGCKKIVFTIAFNNSDFNKNYSLKEWNGEYFKEYNINDINPKWLDDSIWEKEYIRYFSDEDVIYKSLEDSEKEADKYIPTDVDGPTYAGVFSLEQGSGWVVSKNILVDVYGYYKIKGINLSNHRGKTVLIKGQHSMATQYFKSFNNRKTACINYELDDFNRVFTCNTEFRIPWTNGDGIRLIIKTASDETIQDIKLLKWGGLYRSTYRKRRKRYDLSDKTWASIGDSMTWLDEHPGGSGTSGTGMTQGYQSIVSKEIKFKEKYQYGQNGATLPENIEGYGSCFATRGVWKKADIYTIMVQVNGALLISKDKIGTLDDFKNKTGWNTWYGAWREALDYIYSINPKALIIIITEQYINPSNFEDTFAEANKALADATKEVCKCMYIPCVDLHYESGINENNYSEFLYDGTHPNDRGYLRIGKMITQMIKKYL